MSQALWYELPQLALRFLAVQEIIDYDSDFLQADVNVRLKQPLGIQADGGLLDEVALDHFEQLNHALVCATTFRL